MKWIIKLSIITDIINFIIKMYKKDRKPSVFFVSKKLDISNIIIYILLFDKKGKVVKWHTLNPLDL